MDLSLRQKLVRRICSGKLYGSIEFNNQTYYIAFKDPDNNILGEADFIYDKIYKDLKENRSVMSLEESYEKCHASPKNAATTNIGVTMGNISAIAPILALAIVIFIRGLQYVFGIRIKRSSHPKKDRQQALDEFAENLLIHVINISLRWNCVIAMK